MDTWLKVLVAAACCVVIAGGGYFVFQKMQEREAAMVHEKALTNAKNELFRLADASDTEIDKVRQFCEMVDKYGIMTTKQANKRVASTCVALGYL